MQYCCIHLWEHLTLASNSQSIILRTTTVKSDFKICFILFFETDSFHILPILNLLSSLKKAWIYFCWISSKTFDYLRQYYYYLPNFILVYSKLCKLTPKFSWIHLCLSLDLNILHSQLNFMRKTILAFLLGTTARVFPFSHFQFLVKVHPSFSWSKISLFLKTLLCSWLILVLHSVFQLPYLS